MRGSPFQVECLKADYYPNSANVPRESLDVLAEFLGHARPAAVQLVTTTTKHVAMGSRDPTCTSETFAVYRER